MEFVYADYSVTGRQWRLIVLGGVGFALLAAYGLRLIYKGLVDDTYELMGDRKVSRWLYFMGGIIFQIPLVGYVWFVRTMMTD